MRSLSYRFDFSDQLSATGILLSAISTPESAPSTIILNDSGYKASGKLATERIDRGEQVLALDTVLNGATMPEESDLGDWAMMLATDGKRPLGIEVDQLLAVSRWLRTESGQPNVRVETVGMRSQIVALIAASLEPELFSTIVSNDTLGTLLSGPISFRAAPELFCLDLYKLFDIDLLTAMAEPVHIERHSKGQ